ncbi:MAG: hypothetical protein HXY30_11560 [Pseudorhodoplanes sp.]|nr:hypothetical protein [Pseudorhodoplanes sp.]
MPLTADDHRKLAAEYQKLAAFAPTFEDRERLQALRRDHLARARRLDWDSGSRVTDTLAQLEAGERER